MLCCFSGWILQVAAMSGNTQRQPYFFLFPQIKKYGKFEQPRTAPKEDLSWLNETQAPMPEDAPVMMIMFIVCLVFCFISSWPFPCFSSSECVLGHLVGGIGKRLGQRYRLLSWVKPEEGSESLSGACGSRPTCPFGP